MLTSPSVVGKGHVSLNLTLRRTFNLFANVRPCVSIKGFKTPYDDVDTVLIRENTEGEYSGIEHEVRTAQSVISLQLPITAAPLGNRWGCTIYKTYHLGCIRACRPLRISLCSIKWKETGDGRAQGQYHVRITLLCQMDTFFKSVYRKMSDGMFLSACRQVSKEFPSVSYDEDLLDRVCLRIVTNPRPYSDRVMVMPNLYGDILSDMCAGLIGGLGLTPSGNIGRVRLFQYDLLPYIEFFFRTPLFLRPSMAQHPTSPVSIEALIFRTQSLMCYLGKGLANPTALLLSSLMMLRFVDHLGCESKTEPITDT
jgi:isocitrate dehydrogenase (NAD+)